MEIPHARGEVQRLHRTTIVDFPTKDTHVMNPRGTKGLVDHQPQPRWILIVTLKDSGTYHGSISLLFVYHFPFEVHFSFIQGYTFKY